MFQTDLNHCEVVRRSLAGEREIDEQTYTSIAILEARIRQLREGNKIFGEVGFSPVVRKLAMRERKVAVG